MSMPDHHEVEHHPSDNPSGHQAGQEGNEDVVLVLTDTVIDLEVQNRDVHCRAILAERLEQLQQGVENGCAHEVAACIAKGCKHKRRAS